MEIVNISGVKEMEALLLQLPEAVAKKTLLIALRNSAKPILEEARRLAPVGRESKGRLRLRSTKSGKISISNYGKLKLDLKIINIPSNKTEHSATVAVTVGRAFWGMFLEFGTKHQKKMPFMRPAFESKKMEALSLIGKEIGDVILKTANKLSRNKK